MKFPMPSGELSWVSVTASPILSPELQRQHPDLITYRARGITDPTATGRFSIGPTGFHGMLITSEGTLYVSASENGQHYESYWKRDLSPAELQCSSHAPTATGSHDIAVTKARSAIGHSHGGTTHIFRLAVNATGEYTEALGGPELAIEQMHTTINQLTATHERELAIFFQSSG